MKRTSSSTRWARLLLVAALLVMIATSGAYAERGAAAAVVAVDAQEVAAATNGKSEQVNAQSSGKQAKVPEFVATSEWQELLPGQGIPKGLHVRLNLETGKREAKLVDPNEEVDSEAESSMRSVVVDPKGKGTTVTVTTDLSGEVVAEDVNTVASDEDALSSGLDISEEESVDDEPRAESDEDAKDDETNWNHEKIYEVLQALPEPPKVGEMDIHEAHAKLSPAEFRRQMITLWKKRQVELKDAIENIQDDSKYFAKLIEQFYEAAQKGDVAEQLAIMEALEWEVQDLDKTLVFNFIGGFGVIAEHLNSTVLPIRAHAAWVVGSAAKHYYDAQNWIIDAGAVPKLISTLAMEVVNGSEDAQMIIEAKKKALYALSAIVHSNERGQRLFLLHDGPDVLVKLADEVYPTNLQKKALLLAYDLLLDSFEEGYPEEVKANLEQLRITFRTPEWCTWFSSFFVKHGPQLPSRQAIEIMDALRYQLPDCQAIFKAADVKSMVAIVYNALAADEDEFDEEERQELGLFVADVLSWLDTTEQPLVEVEEQ